MSKHPERIKALAIEAIFTSKEHFKTGDWIKRTLFLLVFIPIVTSAIILVFSFSDLIIRICAFLGFLFSTLSLMYVYTGNQAAARRKIDAHMDFGNEYLVQFKKLRDLYYAESPTTAAVDEISKNIQELNRKASSCAISAIARLHVKLTIKGEVDGWPFK
jgi:hypothetical protein